ncbi:hypothetical protein [uncultured Algibacter sp.]|uniref:hypothetical protein n=1 Tax=uncultured Algibacter sp. TaxID=298659 RepID=UPI002605993F|nr:hypothetical protein [uncultured Algibacter sp.]
MGGYIGFGLQKWIYSRNPRKKMFEKERPSSFTSLPKYSRGFKLQTSIIENKKLMGLLTVLITICFLVVINLTYNKFNNYSNEYNKKMSAYHNYKNDKAFNFLMDSGKYLLESNKMLEAYSEFKLAYNIRPNDKELNQLMIETLIALCDEKLRYCDELDSMISNF